MIRRLLTKRKTILVIALVVVAVAAVAALIVFTLPDNEAELTPAEIEVDNGVSERDTGGGKYIFSVSSGDVISMKKQGGGLVVLTPLSLRFTDAKGRIKNEYTHNMTDARIAVGGSSCVFYNRGSSNYTVYKNGSVFSSIDTRYHIYAASVASNGRYSFAVRDDGCTSELIAFNSSDEELMRHKYISESITDLSYPSGGRYVAVCAVGAENARPYSLVEIFDTKGDPDAPTASVRLDGRTAYDVQALDKKTVLVYTDSGVVLVGGGDAKVVEDISPDELRHSYSGADVLNVYQFARYNNDNASCMTVFDKKGEKLYSLDLLDEVVRVCADDKHAAAVFGDRADIYSKSGVKTASVELSGKSFETLFIGGRLVCLQSDGIYSYDF